MNVRYYKMMVWPCGAQVKVALDNKQYHSMLEDINPEEYGIPENYEDSDGFFGYNGQHNFEYVMYLNIEKHGYCSQTLFHEALHLATRMWHEAGANLDSYHNDEVLTYTMNYVANELHKIINHYEDTNQWL